MFLYCFKKLFLSKRAWGARRTAPNECARGWRAASLCAFTGWGSQELPLPSPRPTRTCRLRVVHLWLQPVLLIDLGLVSVWLASLPALHMLSTVGAAAAAVSSLTCLFFSPCSSHTSSVFSLPFREVFRVRCFFFSVSSSSHPPQGYHLHGCSWSSFLDIHSSWQTSLVCDLFLCGLWAKSGFIFLKDYFNKQQRRIYDRDCGQQNLRNLPSGSFQKKPADLRSGILPRQSPPPLPLCALLNQRVLNL